MCVQLGSVCVVQRAHASSARWSGLVCLLPALWCRNVWLWLCARGEMTGSPHPPLPHPHSLPRSPTHGRTVLDPRRCGRYYTTRVSMRTGLSIADTYRAFANTLLPKDAYLRCSGVVRAHARSRRD